MFHIGALSGTGIVAAIRQEHAQTYHQAISALVEHLSAGAWIPNEGTGTKLLAVPWRKHSDCRHPVINLSTAEHEQADYS